MRPTIGLILLAALAGCGASGPLANNTAGAAANAPAAPAPTPAPAPVAATGDEARGLAEFRADALRGCLRGGRETAPPGTPVERHCTCAVDRVMAGRALAELDAEGRAGNYQSRFQGVLTACIGEIGGLGGR